MQNDMTQVRLGPIGLILLAILDTHRLRAQVPVTATPAFEVASVRPSKTAFGGIRGGCRGVGATSGPDETAAAPPLGRCVFSDGRLSHYINIAWGLHNLDFLKSKPDWIARGNARFNIEAKAEDPTTATEEQLLKMFQ